MGEFLVPLRTLADLEDAKRAARVINDHSLAKMVTRKKKIRKSRRTIFLSVLSRNMFEDTSSSPSCNLRATSAEDTQCSEIQLRVRSSSRSALCLQLHPSTAISTLKGLLQEKLAIEPEKQHLFTKRHHELRDDFSLKDHGIVQDSKIDLRLVSDLMNGSYQHKSAGKEKRRRKRKLGSKSSFAEEKDKKPALGKKDDVNSNHCGDSATYSTSGVSTSSPSKEDTKLQTSPCGEEQDPSDGSGCSYTSAAIHAKRRTRRRRGKARGQSPPGDSRGQTTSRDEDNAEAGDCPTCSGVEAASNQSKSGRIRRRRRKTAEKFPSEEVPNDNTSTGDEEKEISDGSSDSTVSQSSTAMANSKSKGHSRKLTDKESWRTRKRKRKVNKKIDSEKKKSQDDNMQDKSDESGHSVIPSGDNPSGRNSAGETRKAKTEKAMTDKDSGRTRKGKGKGVQKSQSEADINERSRMPSRKEKNVMLTAKEKTATARNSCEAAPKGKTSLPDTVHEKRGTRKTSMAEKVSRKTRRVGRQAAKKSPSVNADTYLHDEDKVNSKDSSISASIDATATEQSKYGCCAVPHNQAPGQMEDCKDSLQKKQQGTDAGKDISQEDMETSPEHQRLTDEQDSPQPETCEVTRVKFIDSKLTFHNKERLVREQTDGCQKENGKALKNSDESFKLVKALTPKKKKHGDEKTCDPEGPRKEKQQGAMVREQICQQEMTTSSRQQRSAKDTLKQVGDLKRSETKREPSCLQEKRQPPVRETRKQKQVNHTDRPSKGNMHVPSGRTKTRRERTDAQKKPACKENGEHQIQLFVNSTSMGPICLQMRPSTFITILKGKLQNQSGNEPEKQHHFTRRHDKTHDEQDANIEIHRVSGLMGRAVGERKSAGV